MRRKGVLVSENLTLLVCPEFALNNPVQTTGYHDMRLIVTLETQVFARSQAGFCRKTLRFLFLVIRLVIVKD